MTTKSIKKTHYATERPRFSSEVWIVEAFDERLELWTLGDKSGFAWVLMTADPDTKRTRTLSRAEGIAAIREQWEIEAEPVLLGGSIAADYIDIDMVHLGLLIEGRDVPLDLTEIADLMVRVCVRVRELQFEEGNDRFENKAGAGSTPITVLLGLGLTSPNGDASTAVPAMVALDAEPEKHGMNVRFTATEKAALEKLARHEGRSQHQIVKRLLSPVLLEAARRIG